MGKLNDSLLSGSNGRTGRLVVANVAGTEILRVRPRKRTAPPTAKQELVQTRMKRSYDFVSSYKTYAQSWFGNPIGMKSRFIQAMTNVLNAMKINFTTLTITFAYAEVEFSQGPLLAAVPVGLTAAAANTFTVDWFDNSEGNPAREADQLQLLYYAEDERKSVFLSNAATRLDGTYTASLAPNLSGKTVHVWMAFRGDEPLKVSNSAYVGSIAIT